MPDLSRTLGSCLLMAAIFPSSAFALPWDIDLVDSYFYRAYEWSMQGMPEGTVARNAAGIGDTNTVAGGIFLDGLSKSICKVDNPNHGKLQMPESARDELAEGEMLFATYCAACHGTDGRGGAPVASDTETRFMTAIPRLSGGCEAVPGEDYPVYGDETGASFCGSFDEQQICVDSSCSWVGDSVVQTNSYCDAGLFLTIRNGSPSGIMRGYHQAMDTDEIWSVVNYMRTLPGNDPVDAE